MDVRQNDYSALTIEGSGDRSRKASKPLCRLSLRPQSKGTSAGKRKVTGTSDGLGHLIDELEAFFRVVAENGGQRTSFDYALQNDGDEELIELTYRPTRVSRRYDATVLRWSVHASADYRCGRFES
jgi:hypothetical protein